MNILNHLRNLKQKCINFIFVHFPKLMSDEQYLTVLYRYAMGKEMNWKNPQTFNEKLQWLKVHNRKPEYTVMVDKYLVKKYVAEKIGEEYVIPSLGVWDRVEDIDFDALPDQFVLKCTHDSGGIVICKDKSKLDRQAAIEKLSKGLKSNYFLRNREWPYKNVKPRIIGEPYMCDVNDELNDFKWFCFDGKPHVMFIATDRFNVQEETKFDFYDMDFRHLPFTNGHPNATCQIEKPQTFEKMKSLAEKLSAGIPHVRVDFYDVDGRIYFGELTFFHWSGLTPFSPEEWDYTLGSWIKLPQKTN
ncbi:MAG: glycosyl transferase [Bacteroidales bacterium]|nr:glycosyl transferase [Bacteroidales bacterium]